MLCAGVAFGVQSTNKWSGPQNGLGRFQMTNVDILGASTGVFTSLSAPSSSSTFNNLTVVNDLTVSNDVTVTGSLTANSRAVIDSATVQNDLIVGTDLTVSNDLTVTTDLAVSGDATVTGTMTANGASVVGVGTLTDTSGTITLTESSYLLKPASAATLQISAGGNGQHCVLVNASAGATNVTFTATSGNAWDTDRVLGQDDTMTVLYVNSKWYMIASTTDD